MAFQPWWMRTPSSDRRSRPPPARDEAAVFVSARWWSKARRLATFPTGRDIDVLARPSMRRLVARPITTTSSSSTVVETGRHALQTWSISQEDDIELFERGQNERHAGREAERAKPGDRPPHRGEWPRRRTRHGHLRGHGTGRAKGRDRGDMRRPRPRRPRTRSHAGGRVVASARSHGGTGGRHRRTKQGGLPSALYGTPPLYNQVRPARDRGEEAGTPMNIAIIGAGLAGLGLRGPTASGRAFDEDLRQGTCARRPNVRPHGRHRPRSGLLRSWRAVFHGARPPTSARRSTVGPARGSSSPGRPPATTRGSAGR